MKRKGGQTEELRHSVSLFVCNYFQVAFAGRCCCGRFHCTQVKLNGFVGELLSNLFSPNDIFLLKLNCSIFIFLLQSDTDLLLVRLLLRVLWTDAVPTIAFGHEKMFFCPVLCVFEKKKCASEWPASVLYIQRTL